MTWGSGTHGKLGHGDVKPQPVPKIIDHLTKVNVVAVKVLASFDHMLLLSDKGELWSWGAGAYGETAQNSSLRKMVPHPVLFAPSNVESNGHAENGTTLASSAPTSTPPAVFADIAVGYQFSAAITTDGDLYTWGNARNGVLGNGETSGLVKVATKVSTDVKFTKLSASRDYVIALGSGEGADIVPSPEPAPEEPQEAETTPNGDAASS